VHVLRAVGGDAGLAVARYALLGRTGEAVHQLEPERGRGYTGGAEDVGDADVVEAPVAQQREGGSSAMVVRGSVSS
jgi:hypothetical protein